MGDSDPPVCGRQPRCLGGQARHQWRLAVEHLSRGTNYDYGDGIAVDADRNVYVAGSSQSSWGTPRAAWMGYSDAFVAELDANGALLWNTFLGGTGYEFAYGIALDPSGGIGVTGKSGSTWGTPIREWLGSKDPFVARLDAEGAVTWNTFLGGAESDLGWGEAGNDIVADANGGFIVTGSSEYTWGNPIRQWAGNSDAFVAAFDASGQLEWNTFLGGSSWEEGHGIAVDQSGAIYVGGNGATWGTPIRPLGGSADAFVVKIANTPPVAVGQTVTTPQSVALAIALTATDDEVIT